MKFETFLLMEEKRIRRVPCRQEAKAQSKQSKQGRDYHVGGRQEDRQEKTRKQILNHLIFLNSNPGICLDT